MRAWRIVNVGELERVRDLRIENWALMVGPMVEKTRLTLNVICYHDCSEQLKSDSALWARMASENTEKEILGDRNGNEIQQIDKRTET